MELGDWIGLGIVAIVGLALLKAWHLRRSGDLVIEPHYDPDSPYSPAGAQIMRNLKQNREEQPPASGGRPVS